MLKNLLKKKEQGFTIIEVMIVLAIAGLILVVVLIAVPQLQRNQRNSARQAIMSRISTEIGNYSSNNSGNIPTSAAQVTDLTTRYLSGINRNDPREGTPMGVTLPPSVPGTGVPSGTALPAIGAIFYQNGLSCDGEALAAGNGRTYALWTQQEGGAVYCLDNL